MLRHLTAVRQLARLARPNVAVRCMSSDAHSQDYHDDHGKSAVQIAKEHRNTLNDLPIPSGSYQEYYSKRNATYNIVLAAGVISVIATFILMKQTGTLYLHGPPDYKSLKIDPSGKSA